MRPVRKTLSKTIEMLKLKSQNWRKTNSKCKFTFSVYPFFLLAVLLFSVLCLLFLSCFLLSFLLPSLLCFKKGTEERNKGKEDRKGREKRQRKENQKRNREEQGTGNRKRTEKEQKKERDKGRFFFAVRCLCATKVAGGVLQSAVIGAKIDFLTFQLNCKNIQQIEQQCKQIN